MQTYRCGDGNLRCLLEEACTLWEIKNGFITIIIFIIIIIIIIVIIIIIIVVVVIVVVAVVIIVIIIISSIFSAEILQSEGSCYPLFAFLIHTSWI